MSRPATRGCIVLAVCVCLGRCGSGVTGPSSQGKTWVPPLLVTCVSSPALTCTATFSDDGDVTARASWSAAESFALAMDQPVTASGAVVFRSPGVPTATSARNVYIRADYTSPRYGHVWNIAIHAYAVRPGAAAIPLAYLSGQVFEGQPGPGTALVPDAAVAIIAGEGAGRSVMSGVNGSYSMEFLQLGQPFTIRASKNGYSSDTRDHPGIVDDALGFPSNSAIHFNIQPMR